ncbi:hypothetical protein R1sor_018083 [Riccia sorocarpa]|uniref:Uncharacterized protein n=1 Tax=Riccia sorocarpa TaxID=122646 RepID=A0ABD3ICQ6_9MARC
MSSRNQWEIVHQIVPEGLSGGNRAFRFGRQHRRRKLQLQPDESEESTKETKETSGEMLGSDSELTASSNLEDETEHSTPPYKQDDSPPESEKVWKKFGGRIVEGESDSSENEEAAPSLNPLLRALEDASDIQRAKQMSDSIMEYLVDPEPAEEVVKEPAPTQFIQKKQAVQRQESILGIPQLSIVATHGMDGQTSQDETQLDEKIKQSQAEVETTGWESLEALPPCIRKDTKNIQIQTTVNQSMNLVMDAPIASQNRAAPVTSVPVTLHGYHVVTYATTSSPPVVTNSQISAPATGAVTASTMVQETTPVNTSNTGNSAPNPKPDRNHERVPIPVETTTPSVIVATQDGGVRYQQEYHRSIKGKQVEEPAMVKLDQHFGKMTNPLRLWEVMGSKAQIPYLHVNELLRRDMGSQLPPRPLGVLQQQVQTPGA